jgi:hypothetical protein
VTLWYVGNGAYCYANSMAMVLGAQGHQVEPGLLECLTAFGIGAQWEETPDGRLPFFDAKCSAPDKGVCQALRTLGYRFEHRTGDAEPLAELKRLLTHGPVIVGPVDMGLLVYNPAHTYAAGADHYVVVYALDEDRIHLHDPAGYPHAIMTYGDFMAAWRADRIAYKMGPYSMWGNLQREAEPTFDEMFRATDRQIAAQIREERERFDPTEVGAGMLRQFAEQAREGLSPEMRGHLAHFALPVSTRRCEDFARFYAPYDPERSAIKSAQARLYGQSVAQLMARNYAAFAQTFDELAGLEERFQALTLEANVAP